MKPTYIIILLLFSGEIFSQSIIGTIQPMQVKPGLVYHQDVTKLGYYLKGRYGTIRYPGFYTQEVKFGTGMTVYAGHEFYFLGGLNHAIFMNTKNTSPDVDLDRIWKYSIDVGIMVRFNRVRIIAVTDPINWETDIGIGYTLFRKPAHLRNGY